MLLEFIGGRRVTHRINVHGGDDTEPLEEVYAADFFTKGGASSSAAVAVAEAQGQQPTVSLARRWLRRAQAFLEHIFLPSGYPNSVSEDLLAFALWDMVQVMANNVMSTLSVRAVLLGVGVGESSANLTSSTFSWLLRDGTWMVGSVVFASLISQDLEYRAKTWRLVADLTNDMASFLELCSPFLSVGQGTFRIVVALASLIKALVGVCGSGTRASFTQHFARRGNAAEVSSKAATRGNVGGLAGLAVGMAVAHLVPATYTSLNVAVFLLATACHLFANYSGVRGVQLRHLNVPRMEWCLDQYHAFNLAARVAGRKEPTSHSAMPMLDLSPRRANEAERLFILPALLGAIPPPGRGVGQTLYRFLRLYAMPPMLALRLHYGASLSRVLREHPDMTLSQREMLMLSVEASLSARGVALLADKRTLRYYVIIPEYYTAEGVPESWASYKKQYEISQRNKRVKQQKRLGVADTPAPEDAMVQAAEELKRRRRECVVVPSHIPPLAYRELWAYFYAFMHYRAFLWQQEHLQVCSPGVRDDPQNSYLLPSQVLYLITALRSDGVLVERTGRCVTPYTPEALQRLTAPLSTAASPVSPQGGGFPSPSATAAHDTDGAPELFTSSPDGLFDIFVEFVQTLHSAGWELDRLLVRNEGCTTVLRL